MRKKCQKAKRNAVKINHSNSQNHMRGTHTIATFFNPSSKSNQMKRQCNRKGISSDSNFISHFFVFAPLLRETICKRHGRAANDGYREERRMQWQIK